jgi:hypothetical protein
VPPNISCSLRFSGPSVCGDGSCCRGLGSLAREIIKTVLDVHTELANAFEQWTDIFRDGLEQLQRLGRLSAEADPTRLAHLLLSTFQRGILLAQVARDIAPVKDARHRRANATVSPDRD